MQLKIAGDAVYLSDKNGVILSSIIKCLQYMSTCCKEELCQMKCK